MTGGMPYETAKRSPSKVDKELLAMLVSVMVECSDRFFGNRSEVFKDLLGPCSTCGFGKVIGEYLVKLGSEYLVEMGSEYFKKSMSLRLYKVAVDSSFRSRLEA